ncbi:MAG TPA: helix-turn-helix transcriptional regulator [Pseudonocardiaceae bacterium]|nr:helix-turn-helix transcriptional regulator [Pseudonocardiaceae bacterium]
MSEQRKPFGAELRRRRMDAKLSLSGLAKLVHYSKGYLSKIETGLKSPTVEFARSCDAALGENGELAALASGSQADRRLVDSAGDSDRILYEALTGIDSPLPLNAFGSPESLAATAADHMTVSVFRTLFAQSIQLGELVSSGVVLPTVVTHARTLWSLALAAPPSTRPLLATLATLNTTYAGWLALESGDDHGGMRWSRTAVRLARTVDNPDLLVYTLIREAQVAIFRDDPAHVLKLVAELRTIPDVSPRFRAVVDHREAQAYAMMGEYTLCRRLLDQSVETMLDVDGSPTLGGAPLPPMAGCNFKIGGVIVGWCLYVLGRPGEAAASLDQEHPRIDSTHRRAGARFGVRRALAHAASGEIDRACELANGLLDVTAVLDSATVRMEFRRLARKLSRWHSHGPVRELNPRLTAAMAGGHE